MIIKECKTIEEFKAKELEVINAWIDKHFIKDSVKWERINALQIKITDKLGDTMVIDLKDID